MDMVMRLLGILLKFGALRYAMPEEKIFTIFCGRKAEAFGNF